MEKECGRHVMPFWLFSLCVLAETLGGVSKASDEKGLVGDEVSFKRLICVLFDVFTATRR